MLAPAASILSCLVGLVLLAGAGAPARAATYGQIGEPWGTTGTEAGQFKEPNSVGVDSVDGSVYIGDQKAGSPGNYRVQKFTAGGALKASLELPPSLAEEGKQKGRKYLGVAVDPARDLFYVLETCGVAAAPAATCKESGGTPMAVGLRVFETAESGSELVPAPTPLIPIPTSESQQLRLPSSIAIDPPTGDIDLVGTSAAGFKTFERLGGTGSIEARFEDRASKLSVLNEGASSLAIGPTGTVYTLVGSPTQAGALKTRLWELPHDLSTVGEVPGFAAAAQSENWGEGADPGGLSASAIAISRDGKSIYWKEGLAGEVLVRKFSLATNSTVAVLGGGKSRCQIRGTRSSLGVLEEGSTERLVILDPGTIEKPRNQVITFGEGGDGCPTPIAKFKINGSEADGQTVQAGQVVEFDARPSELLEKDEQRVKEATWDFGDGTSQVVQCVLFEGSNTECERPASLKASHEYETNGEYTVTLEIELQSPVFGNPAPVLHTLVVEGGAPPPPGEIVVEKKGTGTGTVKSAPGGIDCGSSCSAGFESGASVVLTATPAGGSMFIGWSGNCSGAGTCTLVSGGTQAVIAEFEAKVAPTEFELSVSTGGTGTVTSSPTGIDCGSQCSTKFAAGEKVTLTATPSGAASFTGWSGACAGIATTCQVEMTETRSVRASFATPVAGQTLLVTVSGTGVGAVKSAKAGIYCGVVCEGTFKKGTMVTLFPEALPGSEFVAWGGDCTGSALVCELKMSAGRTVEAVFAAKPIVTVTTKVAVPAAAAAATPAPAPATKAKAKEKQAKSGSKAIRKKLAKCQKLKPAARAKCVLRAHRKPHGKRHS